MGKLYGCGVALLVLVSSFLHGQEPGTTTSVFHPGEDARVNVGMLVARSHDASDVLMTSLDLIFHDKSICCGKDSALEDSAQAANPLSLKEVASKLQGRHLLSDGRPIVVAADSISASANNAGYSIIAALTAKHALLMLWNSHFYVLEGAIYDETVCSDGTRVDAIRKLTLIDPRFSDARREVVFNRDTDDWTKVEGMLQLTAAPQ